MFPNRALATPREGLLSTRSWRTQEMMLAQSELCLIKEGWLTEFRYEIWPFGHVLTKAGLPQQYGRFTLCCYMNTENVRSTIGESLPSH
jgi:hypothetical protein